MAAITITRNLLLGGQVVQGWIALEIDGYLTYGTAKGKTFRAGVGDTYLLRSKAVIRRGDNTEIEWQEKQVVITGREDDVVSIGDWCEVGRLAGAKEV